MNTPIFNDCSTLSLGDTYISYNAERYNLLYVYVSGPYTYGDKKTNILSAIDIAQTLKEKNYVPYVPHLNDMWDKEYNDTYDSWLCMDFAWILRCDAMICLPGISKGRDKEIQFCTLQDIPVVWSVQELENIKHNLLAKRLVEPV